MTETGQDTYSGFTIEDETVTGSTRDILIPVQAAIEDYDPDILICSTGEIVPTLYEMAVDVGIDGFSLSR